MGCSLHMLKTNTLRCLIYALFYSACDSCVITLLNDLSTMGDELHLIKSQMQSVSTGAHALRQMKHLEDRAKQLKVT